MDSGPHILTVRVQFRGRGGGQVVRVLAFYSDDPSPNPARLIQLIVAIIINSTIASFLLLGYQPLRSLS